MQKDINKLRQKELNANLIALCKQKDKKGELLVKIEELIDEGADIFSGGSKPIYLAVKNHNFALIELLFHRGALQAPIAVSHISSMCDFREFSKIEDRFFLMIDQAIDITGFSIEYLVPYINSEFVHGRPLKALELSERYPISEQEIVDSIYERIIFEIIDKEIENSLIMIERYREYATPRLLSIAFSCGNYRVCKKLLDQDESLLPDADSVCDAVFHGYTQVLDLLTLNFHPSIVQNALRAKECGNSTGADYIHQKYGWI